MTRRTRGRAYHKSRKIKYIHGQLASLAVHVALAPLVLLRSLRSRSCSLRSLALPQGAARCHAGVSLYLNLLTITLQYHK
nr:MAG TPA: hypothetical protein [Caudoviricetes sp.]